jgi:hypothetical protein
MADDNGLRAWHFKQLRGSLQALARAGAEQPTLFSDHAATPNELAFHFDHWTSVVRGNYERDLLPSQAEALAAVGRKLEIMSRDAAEFDLELWTDAALATSEHWADVRTLAASALEAFDWPIESSAPEPGDRGIAVR